MKRYLSFISASSCFLSVMTDENVDECWTDHLCFSLHIITPASLWLTANQFNKGDAKLTFAAVVPELDIRFHRYFPFLPLDYETFHP